MSDRRKRAKRVVIDPQPATIVGVAAAQVAREVVSSAMDEARTALCAMGFDEAMAGSVHGLAAWDEAQEQIEEMIRAAWTGEAMRVEDAMRQEGIDPEVAAGLKAPAGVLPS